MDIDHMNELKVFPFFERFSRRWFRDNTTSSKL